MKEIQQVFVVFYSDFQGESTPTVPNLYRTSNELFSTSFDPTLTALHSSYISLNLNLSDESSQKQF